MTTDDVHEASRHDDDAALLAAVATAPRHERDVAFRTLVERHRDRVHALCLRYFRDATDAEDATQEAFLRVLRHAGTFRGEARVTTWLHRLTINACHDIARRRARRPQTPVEDIGRVADAVATVDDFADGLTVSDALAGALAQLDEETRGLLLLCSVEGTPYAEVAAAYGIAVGTVKSRVHRARARLVDLLGDTLDQPDDGAARRPGVAARPGTAVRHRDARSTPGGPRAPP